MVDSDSRRQYNQAFVANASSRLKRNIRQVTTVHVHIIARIRGGGGGHGYQPPTLTHPAKFKFFKNYTGMCASRENSREIYTNNFTRDTTGRVHYIIMKKYASDPPSGPWQTQITVGTGSAHYIHVSELVNIVKRY